MGYWKTGEIRYRFRNRAEHIVKLWKSVNVKARVKRIGFQNYRIQTWERY